MKAGTVVTCPLCQSPQIQSTVDLPPGGQMKDAGFVSMGFDLSMQRAGCYKCGELFVRKHPVTGKTQLHTEQDGWIPLSKEAPPTDPPPPPPRPKLVLIQ